MRKKCFAAILFLIILLLCARNFSEKRVDSLTYRGRLSLRPGGPHRERQALRDPGLSLRELPGL